MQLHLLLPGLIWPAQALADTIGELATPALCRLLSRARRSWQPPQAWEEWLCRALGVDGAEFAHGIELPYAPLRLLGETAMPTPDGDYWLCADPVHLGIREQRLVLAESELALAASEAEEIAAATSDVFRALLPGASALLPAAGGRAYLRLERMPQIVTTPPSMVLGRTIEADLPRGPDARQWLRLGNELSMRLSRLELNRKREAEGLPVINSMWFWGAGALPRRGAAPWDEICGGGTLGQGLANWAAVPCRQLPEHAEALPKSGRVLVVQPALQPAAQELAAQPWRDALAALESAWIRPLAARLNRRGLRALSLVAFGQDGLLAATLSPSQRLRFWRRDRPLEALLVPAP